MAMMVDEVSVPSRGFGSDDRPVAARLPPPLLTWFPSPLGVLGLTTCESAVSTWDSECFRPLSGFWV
ncbi:Uncharacterised protein [Mycobacterium tuberculosis]|nr:Uncharacterised protein [Mycobacterium tuberculosis]CML56485.1 Uncharacterised protein [Mycobacterium tuberculosis]